MEKICRDVSARGQAPKLVSPADGRSSGRIIQAPRSGAGAIDPEPAAAFACGLFTSGSIDTFSERQTIGGNLLGLAIPFPIELSTDCSKQSTTRKEIFDNQADGTRKCGCRFFYVLEVGARERFPAWKHAAVDLGTKHAKKFARGSWFTKIAKEVE